MAEGQQTRRLPPRLPNPSCPQGEDPSLGPMQGPGAAPTPRPRSRRQQWLGASLPCVPDEARVCEEEKEGKRPGSLGPGEHPARQTPSRKGLDTRCEGVHGPPPPPAPPPHPSREGQQPHPLPHCSLHSLLPVSPSVHLSSQWADWLPASLSICFLDCHCARLSACDSVSLPVGCQASCGSEWLSICLSVCLSVGLPLCFPIKSVCPPNGQTGLPSLSPPVVRHHNCLSVCLSGDYSLIGQLAAHLSFSLSVCFPLSTWQSVSPAFPSVCLACYSPPPFLPACRATFTHLKSTSLCRGPGLAAPSEAQQASLPAQCDPQPPGQSLSPPSAPPPLSSPGVV